MKTKGEILWLQVQQLASDSETLDFRGELSEYIQIPNHIRNIWLWDLSYKNKQR